MHSWAMGSASAANLKASAKAVQPHMCPTRVEAYHRSMIGQYNVKPQALPHHDICCLRTKMSGHFISCFMAQTAAQAMGQTRGPLRLTRCTHPKIAFVQHPWCIDISRQHIHTTRGRATSIACFLRMCCPVPQQCPVPLVAPVGQRRLMGWCCRCLQQPKAHPQNGWLPDTAATCCAVLCAVVCSLEDVILALALKQLHVPHNMRL
jgi:hypothetical protein